MNGITRCTRLDPRAFTLLEILVVMAIVALLASLSLSAVTQATAMSRRVTCASQMRQLGAAIHLYAAENDGRLPSTSHHGIKKDSWIYTIARYLGSVDEVRICPADPQAARRRAEKGTSYTLNSIVFNPAYDGEGQVITRLDRLPLIPQPARTLVAGIVSEAKFGIAADHTHSEEWRDWASVLVDLSPDTHRAGKRAADRTHGSANYLYADGHVAAMEAADFKRMIEQGINPALPPL